MSYSNNTNVNVIPCDLIQVNSNNNAKGGLADINTGSIQNCKCKINVNETSSESYGGIVGTNSGNIINCINEANITIAINSNQSQAGILSNSIKKNITTVTIIPMLRLNFTHIYSICIGEIAGKGTGGKITNCINNGKITLTSGDKANTEELYIYMGGIIGSSKYGEYGTKIENCKNTGTLKGITSKKGSNLKQNISYHLDNITNCENTGSLLETKITYTDGTVLTFIGGVKGFDMSEENANYDIFAGLASITVLNNSTNKIKYILENVTKAELSEEKLNTAIIEINNIASTTEFNFNKLADGSKESISIQYGANTTDTITINLINLTQTGLNLTTSSTTEDINNMIQTLTNQLEQLRDKEIALSSALETFENDNDSIESEIRDEDMSYL